VSSWSGARHTLGRVCPLLCLLSALAASSVGAAAVFINEIHYDNAGSDRGEAVEVAGAAGTDLAGWSLVAYNGGIAAPAPYATLALSGQIPDLQAGFGVLGFAWQEGASERGASERGALQNGAPDGIALVAPGGVVAQFLSYEGTFTAAAGPAAGMTSEDIRVDESGATPLGDSLGLAGVGTEYADFRWAPAAPASFGDVNPGQILGTPVASDWPVFALQGAGHRSPHEGEWVSSAGIVTAVSRLGFYLQDPAGDGDPATSDAIFVYTGSVYTGSVYTAESPSVAVGDRLELRGLVAEYVPGGPRTGNLSVSELVDPEIDRVIERGVALPAAVVIGPGGRLPPSEVIDDDALTEFLPELDGLDFYESLEGMRVVVVDAVAVSPLRSSGELVTVAGRGAGATGMNSRGGITLTEGDMNPEGIHIDLRWKGGPGVHGEIGVGDWLGEVEGVFSYRYGAFVLLVTRPVAPRSAALAAERSDLVRGEEQLTLATFNVENLDPGDGERFDRLARQIVGGLRSPDILALQEVQDDDGPVVSEIVSAGETLAILVASLAAAGGPDYRALEIPPVAGADGGQPGGNIRVVYLYDPTRVSPVAGSLRRLGGEDGSAGAVFAGSRKPLVARFRFEGREFLLVNLHLSSRLGSDPLFGARQPPRVGGAPRRAAQAAVVRAELDAVLVAEPDLHVVVLGDMNDFGFSEPLRILRTPARPGLPALGDPSEGLASVERYSYLYGGNSQQLDHILVTPALSEVSEIDIVHLNAEFHDAASYHDPVLVRFDLRAVPEPQSAAQRAGSLLVLAALRAVAVRRPRRFPRSAIASNLSPSSPGPRKNLVDSRQDLGG